MKTNNEIYKKLKEPFPANLLHWRIGSTNKKSNAKKGINKATKGIALAYIDARDVMKRLDDVVGFDKWQCRYTSSGICEVGLFLNNEWIWKANGAGETQVEAEKGQASDAFKRACVLWGIGRYLYYIPNSWVDIGDYGKFEPPKLSKMFLPTGETR